MRSWVRLMLLAAVVGLAACENPVSGTRHSAPVGVQITIGEELAVHGSASSLQGEILAPAGVDLAMVSVQFTDAAGEVIEPGTDYWLKVTSSDSTVVVWSPASPGAYTGMIRARAPGSATLRFESYHGTVGRGHRDGDAFDVGVTVLPFTP